MLFVGKIFLENSPPTSKLLTGAPLLNPSCGSLGSADAPSLLPKLGKLQVVLTWEFSFLEGQDLGKSIKYPTNSRKSKTNSLIFYYTTIFNVAS